MEPLKFFHQNQDDWKKIAQYFQKVAQTVAETKNAMIYTPTLNLKVSNIYIKPLSNIKIPLTNCQFRQNCKKIIHQKIAQSVAITLGYFNFWTNPKELRKLAQSTKIQPIWSHWYSQIRNWTTVCIISLARPPLKVIKKLFG